MRIEMVEREENDFRKSTHRLAICKGMPDDEIECTVHIASNMQSGLTIDSRLKTDDQTVRLVLSNWAEECDYK